MDSPSYADASGLAGPRTISTEVFQMLTDAAPSEVWAQLTSVGEGNHIWGFAVDTTWAVGAALHFASPYGPVLSGRILFAEAPRRLSFTLGDGIDPSTYVTWEIGQLEAGSLLRLSVDDVEPTTGSSDEAAVAWLPVLDELRRRLQPSTR